MIEISSISLLRHFEIKSQFVQQSQILHIEDGFNMCLQSKYVLTVIETKRLKDTNERKVKGQEQWFHGTKANLENYYFSHLLISHLTV